VRHSVDYTDFSMRPVHPTQVDNPVTRTVNMVRGGDGSWRRRAGFAARTGPGSRVLNHVACELSGRSMLIVKCADGTVRYWDGSTWATLNAFVDATDRPVGLSTWSTTERGSIEIHAGEAYVCDSRNIAAYDGNASNQLRRPGVKSLAGLLYYKDGSKPSFNLAKIGGVGDATLDDLLVNWKLSESSPLAVDGTIPGITPQDGEKVLNVGFAFSIYDPKRHIYGRRSEVCAVPYIFGPANPGSNDIFLTDERTQYSKTIVLPGASHVPAGHRVAVWFTLGTEVVTNRVAVAFTGFVWFNNQNAPAMSPRMTSVLFLETIADAGSTVVARKDSAALFRSGQYVDAYGRPAPARLLVILPNGTALYFYPRSDPDDANSTIANYAEWSVEHPEQVGRLTENNRDSRSPIANLKAELLYAIADADRSMILTRQTVYQVGFDGRGAVLQDATNGRGIAAVDSICVSSAGVFWIADEGLVALRGGSMALLDKKLGFGDWLDGLDDAKRAECAIGACERTSHLIASMHDWQALGPTTRRCLVFDWEHGVSHEFRLDDSVFPYRFAYFRAAQGSRLVSFTGNGATMHVYPEGTTDGGQPYQSFVEMWLTERASEPKMMQEVTLHLGPSDGAMTVTCDAYEHPEVSAPYVGARSETASVAAGGARRLVLPQFVGMRGRLFRITVRSAGGLGDATTWSISRATVDYLTDDSSDARST